jgi:hypothetical protein
MQGGQAAGLSIALCLVPCQLLLLQPASQQRTAAAAAMGHRSATSQFARQHFLCGHDQIVSADVRCYYLYLYNPSNPIVQGGTVVGLQLVWWCAWLGVGVTCWPGEQQKGVALRAYSPKTLSRRGVSSLCKRRRNSHSRRSPGRLMPPPT